MENTDRAKGSLKVNGEKTSPAPMEAILKSLPGVADALVFGSNRSAIGAAIIPASDEVTPEHVLPALRQVNATAPAHSQIPFELLFFLPVGTTLPRASKGSLQRGRSYAAFEKEIIDAYKRYEQSNDGPGAEKVRLAGEDLVQYVQQVVADVLGSEGEREIDSNTDLFTEGLNSLQSVRVRNKLQKVC